MFSHKKIVDTILGGKDMNFEEFWNDTVSKITGNSTVAPINIYEKDDTYVVYVRAVGYDKDDIKVSVDYDSLMITVEKHYVHDPSLKQVRHEFCYDRVDKRRITFPTPVDFSTTKAKLEKGMLKITINKAGDEKVNSIKIE